MSVLNDLSNEKSPGSPSCSKATALLYNRAADQLTDAELTWFSSSMREQAVVELEDLSTSLEAAACLVSEANLSQSMVSESAIATFLFSLHNQIETISCFFRIAADADFRLKEKAEQAAKSQA
jgi:hypothetical protein